MNSTSNSKSNSSMVVPMPTPITNVLRSSVDSKDLLREAKNIILFTLDVPYHANHHHNLWDRLTSNWKQDRDIAAVAFKNGVPYHGLPEIFQRDRKFLLQGIAKNSNIWCNLPEHLKGDPIFPRHIRKFDDSNLAAAVFHRIPFLQEDRDMWMKVIDSNLSGLGHLASTLAPENILSDRELMLKACFLNDSFFIHVHESLHHDRSFLESVLVTQPSVLNSLPETVQLRFPDLVAITLPSLFQRYGANSEEVLTLAPDVMANPLVREAWFTSGGPFLPERFPESWRDDAQIFMWIAEHRACGGALLLDTANDSSSSFEYASDRLKNDKAFMLQAVEKSPAVFTHASFHLRSDFDLILVAFAGSRDFFEDYMGQAIQSNPTLAQAYLAHFAAIVQEKLQAHNAFFHSVLCGTSSSSSSDSVMKRLDQGPETSLVYKKLIGEFLGVPTGKELRRLRTAAQSFRGWI